ncbi:uncharacterized protein K02A2.6 [Trichonephila clavipes]|nr:uncharacterized protein K02A2.6 [Trichonephila clavipes]
MVSVQNLLDRRCRHRTTIVLGNLGRWPDRVTYYEPEYPYTLLFEPNFGVNVPRTFGKTVTVFTSHLDLTWNKAVNLKFFRVGRSPSRQVREAYQPKNTDGYTLNLTHCTRLADVDEVRRNNRFLFDKALPEDVSRKIGYIKLACFASKKANAKSVKQKQVTLLDEVEDKNRITLYELKIQDCILHEEERKRPPIMILPLTLASDSSPVGIVCGCVLSHVYPDGSERPIMFASRTLSGSEKKYSQIDKEALSIVWAVKKFYLYLKGRRFTLITDHKPLIAIFSSKKGLPELAATRLLHYALILQSFEFDIIFRKTIE